MISGYRSISCISCIILIIILFSCAQSGPELRSSTVKLLRVQEDSGEFTERLSVFILFQDEDGPEDFASITIRNDDSGLFWLVDSGDAVVRLRGSDRWIGSSDLAPPPDGFFPEGDYTIIAQDLAGNEAMHTFMLSRTEYPEKLPVRLSLDGDVWTMERNPDNGGFTENYLFVYTAEDRLVHVWKMEGNQNKSIGDLDTFRRQFDGAARIRCYSETQDGKAGVLLSPVDMQ